ncbi:MAG TPA: MlaD family protein [Candidatus Cloacimonadota bacterium]|nr:MlaD family protein [Candidatus Cloacimonadota bacterium]
MAKFYSKLRSTRIKTGIWTILILLILIFSYLWFTNRLSIQSQQDLRVLFNDVMGLEVGDKIMYRGMEAGRIKTVTLHEDGILVSGRISNDIKPPRGSRFLIEDSLMGSKSLQIVPSTESEMLDLTQIQIGESPVGMMSLISSASASLNKLDQILHDFDSDTGLLAKGEDLLGDASQAVRKTEHNFSEIKTEISQTISSIDLLTRRVDQFIAQNQSELETSISIAPKAINKLNNSLDSLDALSSKLHNSLDALQSGQGTAGKLLTDDDVYIGMKRSIDNLEALIKDIKANPKKYLKFSIF